ncbi:IucA/IucC family siderophore biosynthesis protein [Endozoicomonas sp. SM1973]|uniref:IucA/IucC family siderophore biosynthesis protein n=1 Tax=Spartinivicinus marinus TaxID=2994442 RepID=A0A853IE08_9GAMM|nr:IucA/IucC family siderophore biosynthesis protein [Spartinivicinus marinus]MCX4028351.1 IucA/IucC family siderophore biosynthesis protein [Spartinivicinus marinus]NYZ65686.1 IucA/IucC family siderophore biosynthesis protein [Spartinivicinus marinus]
MNQQALHSYWIIANQTMVAKLISELAYEQAFQIKLAHTEADQLITNSSDVRPSFQHLTLQLASGVIYHFEGWQNIWGQYVIRPSSLFRQEIVVQQESENYQPALENLDKEITHSPAISAAAFMLDAKAELGLVDESLAEHYEDMYATLVADCQLLAMKKDLRADDFIKWDINQQQCLFNGHPKFVFNKGRRGWGSQDLALYAPESRQTFQLCWIAVKQENTTFAVADQWSWQKLIDSAVPAEEQVEMQKLVQHYGGHPDDYLLLPVHPWQWQNKLSTLFAELIANGEIIYLGEWGDLFLPQLSLRTLSNMSRPEGLDIKLPVTIMNTSCYRGIPRRYILAGPEASSWLNKVFKQDLFLQSMGAEILHEPASAFVGHPVYNHLNQAPYRYHELLGVIWRESINEKLKSNETAILMAALMECDEQGQSVIGAYIQASGLSPTDWLAKLFRVVVLPFYHLLCKYGVSLIAHGQNVTIILEDNQPKRILLKDFQGDMRLVDRELPESADLPASVKEVTVKLPEELIIHDLQTGHFVTVLRFISPLTTALGVAEPVFYRLLGKEIRVYMAQYPELNERFQRLDLFKPKILRIGLNLAKFRHQTDSSQSRMLPDMDQLLDNPLYIAEEEIAVTEMTVNSDQESTDAS